MKQTQLIPKDVNIKSMIYEIRGQKVMLDSDLAKLYGYEVKRLNEMVRNNINRFPSDFMFQLTEDEFKYLRSQFVTANNQEILRSKISTSKTKDNRGGRTYLPYVFTEQGIYALSGILKGPLATAVSINLIRVFKELKDFYIQNNYLLDRVINNEVKLLDYQKDTDAFKEETNNKLSIVFDYISDHKEVTEKIFFKGQIYDSFKLFSELISKANKEIILIDNYIDNKTLNILSKKNKEVTVNIYTSCKGNKLSKEDIDIFNRQYSLLTINITNKFHDRFLILDNKTIYLIGASIKDAGNKCFGITEMNSKNIKHIRKELNEEE